MKYLERSILDETVVNVLTQDHKSKYLISGMNHLFSTIFIGISISIGFKIIWSWLRQLYKQFNSNIPNPGIPLPIIGHSYVFYNVSPHDVLNVCLRRVKEDKRQRKVSVYSATLKLLKCKNIFSY